MTRGRNFKIALMAFFLTYALFPHNCGLSIKSITSGLSRGASGRTIRTIPASLVKALSAAFSEPDERENQSSPGPVLIVKKSAVLRDRFDLVPQPGRIAALTPEDFSSRRDFGIADKRAAVMRSWLRKNYACLRLSSGVSPPLLS